MEQEAIAFKDYLPLVGVVVGGVLAVLGGFVSNILIERYTDAREAKRLALAFKGEIQALSHIVRKRNYVNAINDVIREMERREEPLFVNIQVRRDYFNVFKNNVGRIGSLKNPLPEKIARFYVQANSILEDLQSYRDGTYSNAALESVLSSSRDLVEMIEDTFSLADDIVKDIDTLYS